MAREIVELKEHVDHVLKSKARDLVDEKNRDICENFFYEPEEDDEDQIDEVSQKRAKQAYNKARDEADQAWELMDFKKEKKRLRQKEKFRSKAGVKKAAVDEEAEKKSLK